MEEKKKRIFIKKEPEVFTIYKHTGDYDVDIFGPEWLEGLWDNFDVKQNKLLDVMNDTQAGLRSVGIDVVWVLR